MEKSAFYPAGLFGGSSSKRSARDWAVDLTIAVLVPLFGAVILAADWRSHPESLRAVDAALGVVAWVALWRRRRYPLGIAVFCVLCSSISGAASGAALVATFSLALRGSKRAIAGIAALGIATSISYPLLYPDGGRSFVWNAVAGTLFTAVVIGWGLFARARREVVVSLRERGDRLEAEQALREGQAREAERRRIAREMHDVLGHRLSLLSVHAGALEFRPDAPPADIAAAAGVIREAARSALDELRDVMGILRDEPTPSTELDAPEAPQPTLARLPALIEESRGAGMRVTLTCESLGLDAPLPDLLGRTAFRVVQEGLTNARKHAPGSAVAVTVEGAHGSSLTVQVASRGSVRVPLLDPAPGSGVGLVGLAERVGLTGGSLTHGFSDDGSFVLTAELPWAA
jgi:signal transduction histidine kinase